MIAVETKEAGHPIWRICVLTVTALSVGALASLAALGFVEVIERLNALLLIAPRARVQIEQTAWTLAIVTILVPTLGGLVVGLAHRYLSPLGRPLGPPDVIEAVQIRAPLPEPRAGLVSTLTAALSLGAGASVGQYGPMVYLGALIGGTARSLRVGVPNLPAIAIACGVAAAIATAFNAPIAGLVFAHEIVLRHYSIQAFAPVTVASATGYVIANVVFDRAPLFLVTFGGVGHGHEFILFGLLGLVAAGLAIGFMHLVLAATAVAARSRVAPELRPALAGLALGLVALALPDVLGVGTVTLRFATIAGAFTIPELAVLIAAKIAVTALCIGGGFSGGVFSPALLIGSLLGAFSWAVIDGLTPIETSGVAVYAIAGMMAFASAVIGAPLTCILIVFELTRNYDVTIAAMVAVVFSNLIVHRLFGRSLFDVQLARRGVDLSLGRDRARLQAMPVLGLATADYPSGRTDDPPDIVAAKLDSSGWSQALVTDEAGRFAGLYTPHRTAGATVGPHLAPAPIVFDEATSVIEAMERMRDFVGDAVPVVKRGTGRLLGAVTEAAVLAAYLDVSETLRREENAAL